MNDTDEFFDLVGCCSRVCSEPLILSAHNRVTGETIIDNLSVKCGLPVKDSGPEGTQCVGCDKFVILCECGNGLAMVELIGSDKLICSDDMFCLRDNITPEQLHDEDSPNCCV